MSAIPLLAAALLAVSFSTARADRNLPDRLEMEDGRSIRGLILRNTPTHVLLQTAKGEVEYPKSEIRRIHDAPDNDVLFAEIANRGELPSWRAMVHDLRTHDRIKSFEQIPSTTIDQGFLRNVPYLSFRVNQKTEFNVYGDPDRPAAVEIGVYERGRPGERHRRVFREFLAGHLDSRQEIAALYSLNRENLEARAGELVFRLIPEGAADSYGGTWLVVYHPERLERARLSDAAYAKVTVPFNQVARRDGTLLRGNEETNNNWLAGMMKNLTGDLPEVRGFYRDKNGVFRLIGFDES
jgi:hypothetical protein